MTKEMKINERVADMERRRPNWRKRQWLELAALNAESLEKMTAEVKRLSVENKVMRSVLHDEGYIDADIEAWVALDSEGH